MKKFLLIAVAVIGFAALAQAGEGSPTCTFTGNSYDSCNGGYQGSTHYTVKECQDGGSGCYYNY